MVEDAPAKINLGLKVLRRRPDGYHDIRSIFQTVDLFDRLSFERVDDGNTEILCDDPGTPTDSRNLIHRAVGALRECTGTNRGVRVRLDKRIPVGAGLGGGSSDAAAALRALNRVWALGLSADRLRALGSCVGSDVPFLLGGGTALVSGRGEHVQHVRWCGDISYVLVYPGFPVATGWAYRNIRIGLTEGSTYCKLLSCVEGTGEVEAGDLLPSLENDFLPLVEATHPEAREVLGTFEEAGALGCSLSGSGSTLFGAFTDATLAARVARNLDRDGYRVFVCRPYPMER